MANLSGAQLKYADLTHAKLMTANLSQTFLLCSVMSRVDLTTANLSNAQLYHIDLTDANLTNANLKKANLTNINFTNSNLTGATISLESLINLDLNSIVLNKAIILSIDFKWDQYHLDRCLNHINNRETTSIDKMYDVAKIDMIKQIISSLTKQKVDTSTIEVSLIDILVEQPYYADTEISNWLKSVCINYIGKFNENFLCHDAVAECIN